MRPTCILNVLVCKLVISNAPGTAVAYSLETFECLVVLLSSKLSSVPALKRGSKTVAGRCRPIPVAHYLVAEAAKKRAGPRCFSAPLSVPAGG